MCLKIYELIQPLTEFNGAEIVRIRIMGHAHRPTLQIMAERPDCTMDLKLCETLSREYSLVLDVDDVIPSEYVLEVSSPGIDRPLTRLKDFKNWAGFEAVIELNEKLNGRRRFKGIIGAPHCIDKEKNIYHIIINDGEADYEIPFENIKDAKLTLSDALLEATKNGEALHGISCDDLDAEEKSELYLEVEGPIEKAPKQRQKLKKIEDIEETVEIEGI
ncbi:MAG: ribosome maturation factor RimP [Pseudomonadota bacterium]